MMNLLEFGMVACLFANLVVCKGAQFLAWVKKAEGDVASKL